MNPTSQTHKPSSQTHNLARLAGATVARVDLGWRFSLNEGAVILSDSGKVETTGKLTLRVARLAREVFEAVKMAERQAHADALAAAPWAARMAAIAGSLAPEPVTIVEEVAGATAERALFAQIVAAHATKYRSEPELSEVHWIVGGHEPGCQTIKAGEVYLHRPQVTSLWVSADGSVRWSGGKLPHGPLLWEMTIFVEEYLAARARAAAPRLAPVTSLILSRDVGLVRETMALVASGSPERVEVTQTTTPPYPRRSTSKRWTTPVGQVEELWDSGWGGWRWPSDAQVERFLSSVREGAIYTPFEGVNLGDFGGAA